MKKPVHLQTHFLLLFFLSAFLAACSSAKVDESNIIAKLMSLSKYSIGDIDGYLKGQKFKAGKAKTITYPKFQMDILTYSPETHASYSSNFFVEEVKGKTYAVGYTTFSEDEYQAGLKTISDSGFVQKAGFTADSAKAGAKLISKTTFIRAQTKDRVVVTVKQGKSRVYYSFQANNQAESAKLLSDN